MQVVTGDSVLSKALIFALFVTVNRVFIAKQKPSPEDLIQSNKVGLAGSLSSRVSLGLWGKNSIKPNQKGNYAGR